MLIRGFITAVIVLFTLPTNADLSALSIPEQRSFDLVPDPDVSYQSWAAAPPMEKNEIVPPPPPGPYISTALSNLSPRFSNNLKTGNSRSSDKKASPLLRPDTPWPMSHFQPKIWEPENGFSYAPEISPLPPVAPGPSLNRQPPVFNRGFSPPAAYQSPNNSTYMGFPGNYMPPQWNRNYMSPPRPVWKKFEVPMSRYPRHYQRAPQADLRR